MFSPIISVSSVFKFLLLVHLILFGTWCKLQIQLNFFLICPIATAQFIEWFIFIAALGWYLYLILNSYVYLHLLLTVFFLPLFCLSTNALGPQYFIDCGFISLYIIMLASCHFSYFSECFLLFLCAYFFHINITSICLLKQFAYLLIILIVILIISKPVGIFLGSY